MGWLYILISCIFVVLLYVFWLRLMLNVFKVDKDNAFYQSLVDKTNLLVQPMEAVTGRFQLGRIEISILVIILLLELIQGYLLVGLFYHYWFPLYKIPVLVFGDSLIYILNILFFAMVLRMILGWRGDSSLKKAVNTLCSPFLHYSRELLPIMGGFDMAPLAWAIFFKVIAFIIYASLASFMR